MSNNRYSVPEQTQTVKTGKLLYITRSIFDSDWRSFPHTHYFSELFYFLSGQGQFLVEEQLLKVAAGDVVIVNPHVRHTEMSTDKNPLEYIVLGIEGLHFEFGQNSPFATFHLHPGGNQALNEILSEMQLREPHYEQICQKLTDIFLLRLMRSGEFGLSVAAPKSIPTECSHIKRYMDTHFQETLTLETLAEQVHLNKYYLAHLFTDAYGIAPIRYLLELKIRCAQEHLMDSDLSIAHVAQVSGFSSQSYFAQVFKKERGITPAEYRKRAQAAIHTTTD